MDKSSLRSMFSSRPDKFYNAVSLKEFGFTRKKCKKCGSWFWSISKETCGDTMCEGGYQFIGKKDLGWDFLTTIEKWERFFENNRHKVIEPYPVVARWRDDIHFVIASIADFQPWVLNGVAEAPGNPLVVSQPCLRFNDLDNVGRTGRHLSMFFMGGQHAFNLQDYWINEALNYGFQFIRDSLGVNAEDITYREDVWTGGGNFGPSMEAFAGGMEIVNHVFMQFEEIPSGYKEMARKVIDTGWGLERICWFASGKPNVYEAIFPNIAKLREDLGLDLDVSDEFWQKLGLYDVDEGARMTPEVRKKLEALKPLQDLYRILDHTRAVAFALADGSLPSNVGGGYNIRMLLRRALALIDENKFDISAEEMIKGHARYFSRRFKNMKDLPDVDDIVNSERERFAETMKKGKELVEKYMNRGVLASKLGELYESHGVTPETAREISKKAGKEIQIPENFYSRFSKDERKTKEVKSERSLPETAPLYYDKPPEEIFDAKVLWSDGKEVVLDMTQFYPTSGGQDHDTGTITAGKEVFKVTDVYKEGTAIIHVLDRTAPNPGTKVKGAVDSTRRRDIMRHHTAVHIVNGAAYKVLGKHVWQAGAEKTDRKARLDITHYKAVTPDEIRKMEKEANSIVLQNLKVRKMELPRTEAEQKFGFRLYQGGAVPGAKLRTINIPGHDAEACGGVHCEYTGEIGMIKILDAKRIQDGVVRLDLIAGMRSLENTWENEDLITKASEALGTDRKDLDKGIEKMKRRMKAQDVPETKLKGEKVKWGIVNADFRQMQELCKSAVKECELAIMANEKGDVSVCSKGNLSAVDVAREISSAHGSWAGGSKTIARGGARDTARLRETIEKAAKSASAKL
jgi:alanyl-tRNA synthetase